ncbi:hypothetical protein LXL04_011942 [Taraxacum kok-saghyz]
MKKKSPIMPNLKQIKADFLYILIDRFMISLQTETEPCEVKPAEGVPPPTCIVATTTHPLLRQRCPMVFLVSRFSRFFTAIHSHDLDILGVLHHLINDAPWRFLLQGIILNWCTWNRKTLLAVDEELQNQMEQDYGIRYKIIQLAVSWYTGEAAQDDEFEGLDDEDDEKDDDEDEKEDNEDDDEAAAYALAVLCRGSFVTVGAAVCCDFVLFSLCLPATRWLLSYCYIIDVVQKKHGHKKGGKVGGEQGEQPPKCKQQNGGKVGGEQGEQPPKCKQQQVVNLRVNFNAREGRSIVESEFTVEKMDSIVSCHPITGKTKKCIYDLNLDTFRICNFNPTPVKKLDFHGLVVIGGMNQIQEVGEHNLEKRRKSSKGNTRKQEAYLIFWWGKYPTSSKARKQRGELTL